MMFHTVTSGHCWLEVEGAASRLLQQASLVLVPRGDWHSVRSDPAEQTVRLFDTIYRLYRSTNVMKLCSMVAT